MSTAGTKALSHRRLHVLRLGFLQDGDVGVGVFPEGEEALTAASPCVSTGRYSADQSGKDPSV